MKITAVQSGGLLQAGTHEVIVSKILATEAKGSNDYTDRTPQLAVTFKKGNDQQTSWYNLKGFKVDSNGDFILDESGARIEDPEKTAGCMTILGKLAYACGCNEGEDIDTDMLVGKTVKIVVAQEGIKTPYVKYVQRPTSVEEVEVIESENV